METIGVGEPLKQSESSVNCNRVVTGQPSRHKSERYHLYKLEATWVLTSLSRKPHFVYI